jgi:hypothetical protein
MKQTILKTAVAAALGASALISAPVAQAGVATFNWTGAFTMLESAGNALANTSTDKKVDNQYSTPISGTMMFDTVTGAGTATLVPFDFFSGTLPAEAVGINMQSIGDGMGGPGTLVLGNMLFNWDGKNGIPVSLVLDAGGFFGGATDSASSIALNADGDPMTPMAGVPASDGTYVGTVAATSTIGTVTGPGGYAGYLGLGPLPMVTTAWNTSFGPGCVKGVDTNYENNDGGGCMGVSPSGVLPILYDTAPTADYTANTGGNTGGNPMADGPFAGMNANFDVMTLTATGFDSSGSIDPFCDFDPSGNLCAPPVPVPAAVWLFGSGLLGLVGVARRRKT